MKDEEKSSWLFRGHSASPQSPRAYTHIPLPCKHRLFPFQLAGSAVIAFGLWFRFGGSMKDFSSEDKSPEHFYVGE